MYPPKPIYTAISIPHPSTWPAVLFWLSLHILYSQKKRKSLYLLSCQSHQCYTLSITHPLIPISYLCVISSASASTSASTSASAPASAPASNHLSTTRLVQQHPPTSTAKKPEKKVQKKAHHRHLAIYQNHSNHNRSYAPKSLTKHHTNICFHKQLARVAMCIHIAPLHSRLVVCS